MLDDEFLIALDIQQTLEQAGATVTCLGDAKAALEALQGGAKFDCAVLDIKLSGAAQSSLTVAALLTEHGTPFVFLTGLHAGNEHVQAFPHVPLVEKPYQMEALMAALRRVLGG